MRLSVAAAGRNSMACGSGTSAHRRIAPGQPTATQGRRCQDRTRGLVDAGVFTSPAGSPGDEHWAAASDRGAVLRANLFRVWMGAADLAGDVVQERAAEADYATRRSEQNRQRLATTDNCSRCTNRYHNRQIDGPPASSAGPYNPAGRSALKTAKVENSLRVLIIAACGASEWVSK